VYCFSFFTGLVVLSFYGQFFWLFTSISLLWHRLFRLQFRVCCKVVHISFKVRVRVRVMIRVSCMVSASHRCSLDGTTTMS